MRPLCSFHPLGQPALFFRSSSALRETFTLTGKPNWSPKWNPPTLISRKKFNMYVIFYCSFDKCPTLDDICFILCIFGFLSISWKTYLLTAPTVLRSRNFGKGFSYIRKRSQFLFEILQILHPKHLMLQKIHSVVPWKWPISFAWDYCLPFQ